MIRRLGFAVAVFVFSFGLAALPQPNHPTAEPQRSPERFTEPFAIGTATQNLTLRAVDANAVRAVSGRAGKTYAGAFRGVDVSRSTSIGIGEERMVVTDPAAAHTFEYEVVSRNGIVAASPDGRAVRFFTLNPEEPVVTLSAPEVRDRDGKPSHRVWWEISADASGAPTKLRLRIDDPLLVHPISIRYSIEALARSEAATDRALRPGRIENLATTGAISGTLTDAASGDPIPFELVHAYDGASQWVASGVSNASGIYTISNLPAGTYYVLAVPYEWDSELYNENPCPGRACTITSGDPVTVTVGSTTTGINFTLNSLFARIAGTVTNADTNVGLGGVNVIAYNTSGNWAGSAFTKSNGSYVVSLPSAGTYYAKTANFTHAGYVDQVYNGINCTGCVPTSGTAITASLATLTENIDFPLDPDGGSISGQLTDAATGDPIAFEYVWVHNAAGVGVTYAVTDGSGNYTTFNGLATGNYYIYSAPSGYVGEVYNDIACSGTCDPTTGTPLAVTVGVAKTGINIALNSTLTRISGSVVDVDTNIGIASALVGIYDANGGFVDYAITDVNGNYVMSVSGGGTYFARTFASQSYPQYVDELYNDIPCISCNVTTGTQIVVTSGSTTTGIDFALSSNGGSISGRVTDTSLIPIPSATVYFYDGAGNNVSFAFTDANGDYTSFHALAAGTYYVVTAPFGYAGELYNNFPCPDGACDPTTGTGVAVTAGQNTANIDFALASNVARIRGTILDDNNSPAVNVDVLLYDANGNFVTATSVAGDGTYELYVTTGGTHYVATFSNGGLYANELYDNIPCSSCNPTTGTPVTATVGAVTDNINFVLTLIACPTIEVTPFTLPGGMVGDSYTQAVEASGGDAPYTFEVFESSLPTGLTLNASTGDITGTLSAPGEFTFTILATDADGCVGGRTYIVQVNDAPPTITDISPSSGPTTGGTSVTITGTNLSTVSSVAFGATNSGITSVTATQITVDTPPHSVGPVDVTVTTSGGSATATNGFTYVQPTTAVTLVSSLNPSMFGDSVTFTATLEDDAATGTITFYDDATALATVAVTTGTAQYTTSSLSAGSHPITAQYSGDSTYGPSTSNVVNQQVNKLDRTITLDVSPAGSSTYGDTVTITATLTPPDEATSVTFYDGTTVLGTAPVVGNTATFSSSTLQAGSYLFIGETAETANYFPATSAPVAHTVNKAPRSIALTVSPSPSTYGDSVTLTATLSPAAEAATVEFYDGAVLLGSSPVVSGSASFTTSAFNAGTHILTASTSETTNYLGATSAPASHLVNKASPVFSNLTSPTIVVGTASVTVSGTISAGSVIPTGNVTITVAATAYVAAIDGSGNFSVSVATGSLAVGTHPIAFSYAGDANFNPASGSSTLTVTFGFVVTKDAPPKNAPATMPIRIKLVDVNGTNVSSPSITLTAYGFRLTSSMTWLPPNPTGNLQFQNAHGGQYKYNLNTAGLAPGSYVFGFTVAGDPVIHEIPFTVQ